MFRFEVSAQNDELKYDQQQAECNGKLSQSEGKVQAEHIGDR